MEDGPCLPFSILYSLFAFHFTAPRQNGRKCKSRDENGHANKLRGRQAEMMMGVVVVAAKVFDERTRDGVADEVGRKNLAVEFLAPEQPCEEKIQAEVQQRVVNFRRMHRRGRGIKRVVRRETDGPRQTAGAAVTTAVEQAADAAKDTAQRDAWCQHVGDFPERQFFPAQINRTRNDCADEAAVKNESAVPDGEDF